MHDLIAKKTNRTLFVFLVALAFILLRLWYLTVIQRANYVERAKKPQHRVVIQKPSRGVIQDRFGIPLAINGIEYNIAICYDLLYHIPVSQTKKKKKLYPRKEYIEKLVAMLSYELDMDPQTIKDIIFSKAAIFPHTPCIITSDVDERTYYRCKMLEKDYPALLAERKAKRIYPHHKVASSILGYMGSINQKEHIAFMQELSLLESFLHDHTLNPLNPLPKGFDSVDAVQKHYLLKRNSAYTFHDLVGKEGIEKKYESALKGSVGKTTFETGLKGHIIRALPDKTLPKEGKTLRLAISSELQKHAELLLACHEKYRSKHFSTAGNNHATVKPPWIKGGAIVAMIPTTGEIVALASFPRFDPSDFTDLQNKNKPSALKHVHKWLEDNTYIGSLWDGDQQLEREVSSLKTETFQSQAISVDWDFFIDHILSKTSSVRRVLDEHFSCIEKSLSFQDICMEGLKRSKLEEMGFLVDTLYSKSAGHYPSYCQTSQEVQEQIADTLGSSLLKLKAFLDPIFSAIPYNDDKLLLLDLLHLHLPSYLVSAKLRSEIGHLTLNAYRQLCQAILPLCQQIKQQAKNQFHSQIFPLWREHHFSEYLEQKRKEEKTAYKRPYLDYLNEKEQELFETFWQHSQWDYFKKILPSKVSAHPLENTCKTIFPQEGQTFSSHFVDVLLEFVKTLRPFATLTKPLMGLYPTLKNTQQPTEQDLARAFYPKQGHGYGLSFAFRNLSPLGSIFKIVTAYEALQQQYQVNPKKLNPLTITDDTGFYGKVSKDTILGYKEDGQPITRLYKGGRLPRSYKNIGKIDLKTAIERSSNLYFSLLASEHIDSPDTLNATARCLSLGQKTGIDLPGEAAGGLPRDLRYNKTALYSYAIGQHTLTVTPLQTAVMLSSFANQGKVLKPQILYAQPPKINSTTFLPSSIRDLLFEGLDRVVWSDKGAAHYSRIRFLYEHPPLLPRYKQLCHQFIGKTSSTEMHYRPFLNRDGETVVTKDIWFGALSFEENKEPLWEHPELVVVVYLRYGNFGKESAPLAAEIIHKYREIQEKYRHESVHHRN